MKYPRIALLSVVLLLSTHLDIFGKNNVTAKIDTVEGIVIHSYYMSNWSRTLYSSLILNDDTIVFDRSAYSNGSLIEKNPELITTLGSPDYYDRFSFSFYRPSFIDYHYNLYFSKHNQNFITDQVFENVKSPDFYKSSGLRKLLPPDREVDDRFVRDIVSDSLFLYCVYNFKGEIIKYESYQPIDWLCEFKNGKYRLCVLKRVIELSSLTEEQVKKMELQHSEIYTFQIMLTE